MDDITAKTMSEDLESLKDRMIKALSTDLGEVQKSLRKTDLTKEQRKFLIFLERHIQLDLRTLMSGRMNESETRKFCERLIKNAEL